MADLMPVAEAVERIRSAFAPLAPEQVGLESALGRVLAEDVASRIASPPADVSAMDGYALRAEDGAKAPFAVRLIGEAAAGSGFAGTIEPGTCVRIFTGALIPSGADAIAIQEDTEADGEQITVREPAVAGRWIRRGGMDFRVGDVLLHTGCVITGRDIGLAAAMNVPWLAVRRKPRVAILATGDELVMPGEPVGPGQIVGSNSLALAAYVTAMGGDPVVLGIAKDTTESLLAMLDGARGADLLITIGGASVGDYDLVQKALGAAGFDLNFYRVAMRPGKPLIFGRLRDVPVIGLPGNPVSVGVTSIVYVRPAIHAMLGIPPEEGPAETAILGRDLAANDLRQDYLRARLSVDESGRRVATPFDKQDSALMARFAEADCLVMRPPHAPPAKAGEVVEILVLRAGLVSL